MAAVTFHLTSKVSSTPKQHCEQWQISPPGFDLYQQTGRSVMRKAKVCPQNFLSWLPDERVLAPLVLFPSSWLGGPWEGTSGAAGEPCPGRVWCPCGAGPGAVGADKAWTCEESPVPGLEGEAGLGDSPAMAPSGGSCACPACPLCWAHAQQD